MALKLAFTWAPLPLPHWMYHNFPGDPEGAYGCLYFNEARVWLASAHAVNYAPLRLSKRAANSGGMHTRRSKRKRCKPGAATPIKTRRQQRRDAHALK